jgi:DNA polymerase III epsilon subunit-like protein
VSAPDLVFVDLETGGLDECEHEILEVAAIRVDARTLVEISRMSVKVAPTRPVPADAAAINGYTPEAWVEAATLDVALALLAPVAEGARWAGSNPAFDYRFVRRAATSCGREAPRLASHRLVDVSAMCEPLVHAGLLERAGIDAICRFFGIPVERRVHRAEADAEAALAVYRAVVRLYQPAIAMASGGVELRPTA